MNGDTSEPHRFGSGEPFTLGLEEELFLVDSVTGRLANSSGAVKARVQPLIGRVEQELHACQLELVTDICADAGEAIAQLADLRSTVFDLGIGLIGSGTHPSALEGEAGITDKERYERIGELLGDAIATPVGGLHIHVGMPDAETAIRAFNGLRRWLPLLQALGANSPYRHGRDTGLASAREVTVRGWPRSGVPRAMRDYEDFCSTVEVLTRAADVPDYTWFWWKLRPHPRLGTVEIRALDVQASLRDTGALAALTHCLARHAAEHEPVGGPPAEVLEEGSFRAARFGVQARLPDRSGHLRDVGEVLEEALQAGRPFAEELGCSDQLERLDGLLTDQGGAGRQRRIYELAGMDSLLRELLHVTAADTKGQGGPSRQGRLASDR